MSNTNKATLVSSHKRNSKNQVANGSAVKLEEIDVDKQQTDKGGDSLSRQQSYNDDKAKMDEDSRSNASKGKSSTENVSEKEREREKEKNVEDPESGKKKTMSEYPDDPLWICKRSWWWLSFILGVITGGMVVGLVVGLVLSDQLDNESLNLALCDQNLNNCEYLWTGCQTRYNNCVIDADMWKSKYLDCDTSLTGCLSDCNCTAV